MRQRVLQDTMPLKEILEWLAYDLSCDKEFRDNIEQSKKSEKEQVLDFFKTLAPIVKREKK